MSGSSKTAATPEIVIDRPKGFAKTFHTANGPVDTTYPVDYGYYKGLINPQDGEDADVFVGSGGGLHGRYMKGNTTGGAWQPDEHKWYTRMTPAEKRTMYAWWRGQDPTGPKLIRQHKRFPDEQSLLADISGLSSKAAGDMPDRKKKKPEESHIGEQLAGVGGAAGLGAAGLLYGAGHGLNTQEEAALHRFGQLDEANIADPRTFTDEYVTRGSAAAKSKPWGMQMSTFLPPARIVSGFDINKPYQRLEGLNAYDGMKQHYNSFAAGPIAAYMQLQSEAGLDKAYKPVLDDYLKSKQVSDWHKLNPADQDKLYRGFDPFVKAKSPAAWVAKQTSDIDETDFMRKGVHGYNSAVHKWDNIKGTVGKALPYAVGAGVTGLALYAWLRHRRKQKEEAEQAKQTEHG